MGAAKVHVYSDWVLCLGRMAWSFRSDWKMEKSNPRLPTIQLVCRGVGNWWRSNGVRVEYVPRNHINRDPQKDPGRSGSSKNRSRTIRGNSSIHVDVQWHRLDTECKFIGQYFRVPKKWENTRKDFSENIDHSSVLELQKNGMERTLRNRKGIWMKASVSWLINSKKVDIRYSEVLVRSTEESWRRKVEELRFTLLRNLRE